MVELRDNRYTQVVHMVTAANGAEEYYNTEDNPCRTEGVELARELDQKTAEAWVGHPYIDVIDNATRFDAKIRRMIDVSFCLLLMRYDFHVWHPVWTVCLSTDRNRYKRPIGEIE